MPKVLMKNSALTFVLIDASVDRLKLLCVCLLKRYWLLGLF